MFQGSDELRLEVARTSNLFALGAADLETEDQQQQQLAGPPNETPILTGYLWKKSQSASRLDESGSVWYRRWFVLKRNNCLYYYKNQDVSTCVMTFRAFLVTSNCSTCPASMPTNLVPPRQ